MLTLRDQSINQHYEVHFVLACVAGSLMKKNLILLQNTCMYYTEFTGIHVYTLKYYYAHISQKPI